LNPFTIRKVGFGLNATEPFDAGADQCLQSSATDQIADKSSKDEKAVSSVANNSKDGH